MLRLMLLCTLAPAANAVGISSFGVPQMTGSCAADPIGTPGLPCLVETGDVLDTPFGGTVTVSQPPVDDPERLSAAIYDGTGIYVGTPTELGRMESDATNGLSGFTVYTEFFSSTIDSDYALPNGDTLPAGSELAGNISLGYFRYTGDGTPTYLVVKGASEWGIWDINTLPTVTHTDGLEYYKWDWTSARYDGAGGDWVGVWDEIDVTENNAMSHISLYGYFPSTSVPAPGSLLLLLGGLLYLRRFRSR